MCVKAVFLAILLCLALGSTLGCAGIRLDDIDAPHPVPAGSCVIVGFLGGRDSWNDEQKGVRKVALRLRDHDSKIFAETFENRRRDIAEAWVVRASDRNADGKVSDDELQQVKLLVYGQSFGGAATAKFAKQLESLGIPIHLTVQIDSVGRGDDQIPPNVRHAANLYQDQGWIISGEHPIRAVDVSRTRILGNWRFEYNQPPGSEISIDDLPWWKILFRVAHARMDRDERVWSVVEELIHAGCQGDDFDRVITELTRQERAK